jgi:hypothetical protein
MACLTDDLLRWNLKFVPFLQERDMESYVEPVRCSSYLHYVFDHPVALVEHFIYTRIIQPCKYIAS